MSKRKRGEIPDGQEVQELNDANELFRSSSFKLQIDALLQNILPAQKRIAPLERFLRELHAVLIAIPSSSDQAKGFQPPKNINLAGSWQIPGACIRKREEGFQVDVAVDIPEEMLSDKDHTEARFLKKRKVFLEGLKTGISESDLNVDIRSLQGTLVLRHRSDGSSTDFTKLNASVLILPTLPLQSIVAAKANPSNSPSVLLALHPIPSLVAFHELTKQCPAAPSTRALLQVWSSQRLTSVGGLFWGSIIEAVLAEKGVGKGASNYQLYKSCLGYVATKDFAANPVYLSKKFDLDDFGQGLRLIDSTGLLNVLSGIIPGTLDLLKQDALDTLSLLSKEGNSSDEQIFAEIFLHDKRSTYARFDTVLRITSDTSFDHNQATEMLRRGLGNRCSVIMISANHVLLVHDPVNFGRLVDHGPPSLGQGVDDPEGDDFRALWGSKAELRRFKDGRINEAVAWDGVATRFVVPAVVATYLMNLHFGVELSTISFDEVIGGVGAETTFRQGREAVEELLKELKAIDEDELPLGVTGLSAATPLLRSTSPFAPSSAGIWRDPLSLIIEYERNTRWPNDIDAIQKVKLALLEQSAAALMKRARGMVARIAVPSDREPRLEVTHPKGWVFHATMYYDREIRILAEQNTKSAAAIAWSWTRDRVHSPLHHRLISTLAYRYPAFAPTVRVVTRWLASHWLYSPDRSSQTVNAETVELLCAFLFVGKQKSVPGTKEAGFSRAIEFLKDWKWENNEAIDIELVEDDAFESATKADEQTKDINASKGIWTIRTNMDSSGSLWTAFGPDLLVARRIRDIAQATWAVIRDLEQSAVDYKSMFRHPTDAYDFLIHLNPDVAPRRGQKITDSSAKAPNYANETGASILAERPGLDPIAALFTDLTTVYADTLRLFYDPFGGLIFGGLWDVSLKGSRKHKAMNGFSSRPLNSKKEKGMVELNRDAILDEIARLGEGIITSIVQQ